MTDSENTRGDLVDLPESTTTAPIAGLVLAGGRSRRMGTDKASLQWPDDTAEPMLARIVRTVAERCDRVYVVAAQESSAYRLLHGTGGPEAVWVTDEEPGTGPLGGLAAGLAAAERKELMALVRSLVTEGVTVLYTEHNMDAVFGVADRVLVLIDGQLAASGPPDAVAQDDRVRGRYLGHDFGFGSGGGA